MFKKFFFIFILLPSISKCFIETNQNLIESLIKELNVKHLNIITDPNFQINFKIFNFAKYFSQRKISINFFLANQMENLMNLYYKTPIEYYVAPKVQNIGNEIDTKRANLVYPPKNMVLFFENSFAQLFKVSVVKNNFLWI